MPRTVEVKKESWPIAGRFTISRGSKQSAEVIVASISEADMTGRGECVPYARYGETIDGVAAAISAQAAAIGSGMTRQELQREMAPGAARNAIDCALWDLEARTTGLRAAELAGISTPRPQLTAYTISLGKPEEMAAAAAGRPDSRLLKLKLGADGDEERLAAVRSARPDVRLIADANEGWRADQVTGLLNAAAEAGVELVEQPLPAADDGALEGIDRPVPVCADEALHQRSDLKRLSGRYDAINVKLDKSGGLTEALLLIEQARAADFKIMVGCMVATSLAMAPGLLAAQGADWVDLDGPLLLERDRENGLIYANGVVSPPSALLWG